MKQKLLRLLMIPVLLLMVSMAYAQTTVTGTVTDPDGLPLPGASISVKGTTIAQMTDIDGNYTIDVPESAEQILVFSYIGTKTQELPVASVVNCQLLYDEEVLDEVLVVGYGTMKKSDRTGAVTNVTAEELNGGVNTDPIQGLQGKAAGVMITKKGGDPSSGFSVKIRGATGFASGTEPLYVVDGVPGVDPTTVASEDIESFNVLKDASSTAIYGSRGSNGVIIITTKSGKARKGSKVEINSYVAVDNVANRLDLLSADQVRQYVSDNGIDFTDGGANTDWQDAIYRQGISQSHNMSVSGGNDQTTYYASGSHSSFEGVVIGSQKTRTVGRINLSQKGLNERLTVQTGLSGTIEGNDYLPGISGMGIHSVLYQAFRRSPTDSITLADGSYHESDRLFDSKNPVASINEITNHRDAKRFLGNMKADLTLFDGFSIGTNLAYIRDDSESFYALPTYSFKAGEGYASRSYTNYQNKLLETTANYVKEIDKTHNMNFVVGYSYQEETWGGFNAGGSLPASDYVGPNNLGVMQNVQPGSIGSSKGGALLISMFGRTAYNYKSKYYLTATVRRDGSSKFGPNNKWGVFPSASVAWNVKQEGFLYSVDFISMLKFRAGYGLVGNQNIGTDLFKTLFGPSGTSVDPETGETVVNIVGDKNANPDLQWETNKEMNIGLDYGFANNRLSGTIEYYSKTIDKLLAAYNVPQPPNPYPIIYANEGTVNNSGIEFQLQAYAMDNKNFDWKTTVTFSTNKQDVVDLGSKYEIVEMKVGGVSGPGLVGGENWTQIVRPGLELGTFYLPEYAGLTADGKFLFYTAAGGVTRDITMAERRIAGSAMPDFEFGWSNNIKFFKNIELNFAFRSVWGYDLFNATKLIFGNPNGLMPNGNILVSALDEKERGLTSSPTISDYYLEDASFVRLDNVTLGYNFNTKNLKGIERIRVYASSNNTWLYTKYTGLDPEITYTGLSFGVDNFDVYPKTRTFTFGVNVSF